MLSNTFDAEYGRNSGAVINVVTKSGTNQFHGSVFEFFRNTVLNSHGYSFQPTPKPPFNQNQFGGTMGGPIKKDKTFFFGSYEGRRIVRGIVSIPVPVPTGAELAGNFGSSGSVFGGTLNNWDMGFFKDIPFNERLKMEFRGEIYNIWNHTQFFSIDGNVGNQGTTFGQPQKTRDPRLVQFALKLFF